MLFDPNFSIGDFANFINVDSSGKEEKLKVKIVGRFEENNELYYIIASDKSIIEKIGIPSDKHTLIRSENPNWDVTYAAADELEKATRLELIERI